MATEKAFLETEAGVRIPCLFNPSEFTVGRKNEWSSDPMPGKGVPKLSYTGARGGWSQRTRHGRVDAQPGSDVLPEIFRLPGGGFSGITF